MFRNRVLRWPIERLFTKHAQRVLELAVEEAASTHVDRVTPEHMLLGLTKNRAGVGAHCLGKLGIDLDGLAGELTVDRDDSKTNTDARPELDQRTENVLNYARLEAHALKHRYVGTEHLLLGLIKEDQGKAANALTRLGVTHSALRNQVISVLKEPPPSGWTRP